MTVTELHQRLVAAGVEQGDFTPQELVAKAKKRLDATVDADGNPLLAVAAEESIMVSLEALLGVMKLHESGALADDSQNSIKKE